MTKLTDGELERLINSINILDTYQQIFFAIRDSKGISREMNDILNTLPEEDYVDKTLEENLSILYDWGRDATKDNLDTVIRKINPGMMRMNLRAIYKSKEE